MPADRDPLQVANNEQFDLYDVATWDVRTPLDRFSAWLHGALLRAGRATVVALAVLIVVAQFAAALGLVLVDRPIIGVYVVLSVFPAMAFAGYVWKVDVTMQEPLELLVVTFSLGFLFAGFAAVLNSAFSGVFMQFATPDAAPLVAFLAPALYFFLVVGPVEETVKWLAIRLYAYRSDRFDAVVDGAVYGAVAGLGFATIENAIYIAREVVTISQIANEGVAESIALQTAAVRTLAGPGHVIYSAFAGYYLGLAKFNPENRGPIVVKGLVVASVIHATYNTSVTNLGFVADTLGLPSGATFLAFVVAFDGLFFYLLYRKLAAYRAAFEATGAHAVYEEESGEGASGASAVSDASSDSEDDW
jgi:RsiW-degrading membrane proteinase PrsW (M82 family)